MEISVSAYPEKHPESPSLDADIDLLKAKVDAGATRAITQFFFDNDLYFRYLDRVRAAGINIPIVPGILPVQNFTMASNFAKRAGATMPNWLAKNSKASTTILKLASSLPRPLPPGRSEPCHARHGDLSFLHHEPRGSRVCHQPPARHPPESRAESCLIP